MLLAHNRVNNMVSMTHSAIVSECECLHQAHLQCDKDRYLLLLLLLLQIEIHVAYRQFSLQSTKMSSVVGKTREITSRFEFMPHIHSCSLSLEDNNSFVCNEQVNVQCFDHCKRTMPMIARCACVHFTPCAIIISVAASLSQACDQNKMCNGHFCLHAHTQWSYEWRSFDRIKPQSYAKDLYEQYYIKL